MAGMHVFDTSYDPWPHVPEMFTVAPVARLSCHPFLATCSASVPRGKTGYDETSDPCRELLRWQSSIQKNAGRMRNDDR